MTEVSEVVLLEEAPTSASSTHNGVNGKKSENSVNGNKKEETESDDGGEIQLEVERGKEFVCVRVSSPTSVRSPDSVSSTSNHKLHDFAAAAAVETMVRRRLSSESLEPRHSTDSSFAVFRGPWETKSVRFQPPCLLRQVSKYGMDELDVSRKPRGTRLLSYADEHGSALHATSYVGELYYSKSGVMRPKVAGGACSCSIQ